MNHPSYLAGLRWTKLSLAFDPEQLRADLATVPEDAWVQHFNQADFEGDWSSVSLRSRSGRSDDILPFGTDADYRDTPLLQSCPHLRAVVQAFDFPLKAVRLLRLHPRSRIKEHSDQDLLLSRGELRIHIPIETSDEVEFIVANRRLRLAEGESWYIDFSQPHRIENRGHDQCVHMVIDGTVNDWATELLERSAREILTETELPAGSAELERFQALVVENPQLQIELLAIQEPEAFLNATVAAGSRLGFTFTYADAESAYKRGSRDWTMRMVVG